MSIRNEKYNRSYKNERHVLERWLLHLMSKHFIESIAHNESTDTWYLNNFTLHKQIALKIDRTNYKSLLLNDILESLFERKRGK